MKRAESRTGRPTQAEDAGQPVTLRCLGGKPAPADLAADLGAIARLPEAARAALWSVLGPSLGEPLHPEAESMLDAFCRTHGLDHDALARPLKACRFLLREAARGNADRETFAEDVRALGGQGGIEQLLLAGYDAACLVVRQEILQGTLADHGKLLLGVDWRLDSVQASNRGSKMRVPVALLTLRYREGDQTGRITLQVLPETLRQLTQTLTEIVP